MSSHLILSTLDVRSRSRSQSQTRKPKKLSGRHSQTKRILKSFVTNRSQNLSNMLQSVCKNYGTCLSIGHYNKIIKSFFQEFTDLNLVDSKNIKKIGNPSNNGFVLQVPFQKNGFESLTALKCSMKETSDNLYYEYYVGKNFINHYVDVFPCFVETYGLYTTNSLTEWKKLVNIASGKLKGEINLKELITHHQNITWGDSCIKNKQICILIQHFSNFTSLHEKCYERGIQVDFPCLLYQIYFPLTILGNKYTHYDLHDQNIFLYKPYQGKKYIQFTYHTKAGKIFSFPSEYMVKIIDYGRNYFNKSPTNNTKYLLKNKICPATTCVPNCGEKQGYSIIQGNEYDPNVKFYSIMPNQPNVSHDLRAIKQNEKVIQKNFFTNIHYKHEYGTNEIREVGLTPGTINNIFDLRNLLELYLHPWISVVHPKKYDRSWTMVSRIDVYEDGRDYEFTIL